MTEVWICLPRLCVRHGDIESWCKRYCESFGSRFVKVVDVHAGWGGGCDKAKVLVESLVDACDGNLGVGSYVK